MATAEIAVAIPSLLFVLGLGLTALGVGVSQIQCVDAARTGARLLARGEPLSTVDREVRAAAPDGAAVLTSVSGDVGRVTVTATLPAALAGIGLGAGPSATATALVEQP